VTEPSALDVVHLIEVRDLLVVEGVAHTGAHIVAGLDELEHDMRSDVARGASYGNRAL